MRIPRKERPNVPRFTKWLLAVIVLVGAAVLAGREVLWRIDHVPAGPTAVTLAGIVFETYLLPERSEAPYGVGVFARHFWNPLRSLDGTLVFAAYCGKDFALKGASDAALEITCSLREGPPKLLVKSFAGVPVRLQGASG
jgi:hypothetical protein